MTTREIADRIEQRFAAYRCPAHVDVLDTQNGVIRLAVSANAVSGDAPSGTVARMVRDDITAMVAPCSCAFFNGQLIFFVSYE